MPQAWGYRGAPPTGATGAVTTVEGLTFCISDRAGDIHPGHEHGLFFRDTRFLSRMQLSVDARPLDPLAARLEEPYSAQFVTRRPPADGTADSTLLVLRHRYVGNGMLERITLRNLGREPAGLSVALAVDTDFAGLFDVKEGRATVREGITRAVVGDRLVLSVETDFGSRATTLASDGASVTEHGLTWAVVVPPRESRTVDVEITVTVDGEAVRLPYRTGQPVERSAPARELRQWRANAPDVETPDPRLAPVIARSMEDLGVLRITDAAHPDRAVVAAGAPWFMTLFGRDSLLTSWMLLPVEPTLATATARTLADLQGQRVDPLTEEEPGKILHEVRSGLDAQATLGGDVYYGTIDATPLFVMLLGELRRWGAGRDATADLLPHVDRALAWIVEYGDRDGDGFVEYQRATDRGLVNQGWKDSFDGVPFASGRPADPPIALAEVQGYVYAAYRARARWARDDGDPSTAQEWEARAERLRRRFDEQFWLPDRGYFALALDGEKRPVDALASNMGHCLWTGIVDPAKSEAVARALLSPEMFTGFGVRTLASSMAAYNPMSYHNGSVWPHDNAIVAAGLARYGHLAEAQRIADGLLDAAVAFGYRLPELFCGFDRAEFPDPIPYPTSCSPQAWAAAAPLLLLRSLLRLDPDVPDGVVRCAPGLPKTMRPLTVRGLTVGDAEVAVVVDGDRVTMPGLPGSLRLLTPPPRST